MSETHDHGRVGYKSPPPEHQFRKGQPRPARSGRKKGSRNLRAIVADVTEETLPLSEGGGTGRISKLEALIKTTMARAIRGDQRATATMIKLVYELIGPDGLEDKSVNLSAEDRLILNHFLSREGGSYDYQ